MHKPASHGLEHNNQHQTLHQQAMGLGPTPVGLQKEGCSPFQTSVDGDAEPALDAEGGCESAYGVAVVVLIIGVVIQVRVLMVPVVL